MESSELRALKSFFQENPVTIEVDSNNCFVMRLANKVILPITTDTAVNLLRLIELEYKTFYDELQKAVDLVNIERGNVPIIVSEFPFNIIVKAALKSEINYWIELSIPWIKAIGKKYFLEEIKGILRCKNISQKNRHIFLKL